MAEKQTTVAVRATPETEQFFRDLMNDWPELKATVRSLVEQDMFPGIRCMTVRLEVDQSQSSPDVTDEHLADSSHP